MARTSGMAGPGFTGVALVPTRVLMTAIQCVAHNAQGPMLALAALLCTAVDRGILVPRRALFAAAVFCCAIVPQVLIHSKSGFPLSAGRYLLPSSLVHALPIALLLQRLDDVRPGDRSSQLRLVRCIELGLLAAFAVGCAAGLAVLSGAGNTAALERISALTARPVAQHWPSLLRQLGYALATASAAGLAAAVWWRSMPRPARVARSAFSAMAVYFATTAWLWSRAYAREGWETMCTLNSVEPTGGPVRVLMVIDPAVDPPEKVVSLTEYLRIKKGICDILYHLLDTPRPAGLRAAWRDELLGRYSGRLVGVPDALDSVSHVMVISRADEFVRNAGDRLGAFSRLACGSMAVYRRAMDVGRDGNSWGRTKVRDCNYVKYQKYYPTK